MSRSREEAVAAGIQVNDIQHNMKRRTKQIEDALTHPLLLSTECMWLFEDQLCEIIEAILPDNEVVLSLWVVDKGAGDALLVAEGLELCSSFSLT